MPLGESTQLLSKETALDLMADMLKQAEEDKTVLLEALQRYVDCDGYEDAIKEQGRDAIEKAG